MTPTARRRAKFAEFMGRRQGDIFEDPLTRRGCELWIERVVAGYGEDGGVDVEIIEVQLPLCARTAGYLYSDFTPLKTAYQRGSRPLLEGTVAEVLRPGMTARQKMLAIMRRCRDNRRRGLAKPGLFFGGSEEELLKRGAEMCNEIARVFVCLCQVAGLPARTFSAHITGHMMGEVYTDGKWGWVDPRYGMAPVTDRDEPASAWDLLQDPKLLERQPRSFWKDVLPADQFGRPGRHPLNLAYRMALWRDCMFHPREATSLGNYFAWEQNRYTYPWSGDHDTPEQIRRRKQVIHREYLNRKALGWPDYYFNPLLFNEALKMRK
jgi:hypothetical protein